MTEISLNDWAAQVADELGFSAEFEVDQVLDLAADAAHNVKRPAAPLTTFLAGLAAGRSGGSATDIAEAIARARSLCNRQDEGP